LAFGGLFLTLPVQVPAVPFTRHPSLVLLVVLGFPFAGLVFGNLAPLRVTAVVAVSGMLVVLLLIVSKTLGPW
jgi:hypothetical protein